MLFDGDGLSTIAIWSPPTRSSSPTPKPYKARLKAGYAATGIKDAVIVGSGHLDGIPTIVAAQEYAFIGGSMGVVVGEKITRAHRAGDRRALPGRHRLLLGRRAHDGRRALADADGEDLRRPRPARSRAAALHRRAHRSDDRRRDRELRHARRPEHRRAEGADRICRPARHRADDPPETAGRISALRVPAREGHARSGRRSARDEGDDRRGAALHGRHGRVARASGRCRSRGRRAVTPEPAAQG